MFIQLTNVNDHFGKISIIEGILFLLIGCFVIFEAVFSSEIFSVLLGFLMIFLVYHSFKKAYELRNSKGQMLLEIVIGLLYGYVAFTFIANPIYGVISIALLIGWTYLFIGVYKLILTIQNKNIFHRGIIITGSIINILIGLFLVLLWPIDSIIIVATMIAVEIITSGIILIAMGIHALKH